MIRIKQTIRQILLMIVILTLCHQVMSENPLTANKKKALIAIASLSGIAVAGTGIGVTHYIRNRCDDPVINDEEKRVFLVRHAHSQQQAALEQLSNKDFSRPCDTIKNLLAEDAELTPTGVAQLQNLKENAQKTLMKDNKVESLWASPLIRAQKTARAILGDNSQNIELQTVNELHEQTIPELIFGGLKPRIRTFENQLGRSAATEGHVVVGHSKYFQSMLKDAQFTNDTDLDKRKLDNCEIVQATFRNGKWRDVRPVYNTP